MEIAIISGKGGTGKSTVCAAFVSVAQSTIAVDCDVDASNLYLIFSPSCDEEYVFVSGNHAVIDSDLCMNCGLCMSYCRFDAISSDNGLIRVSEVACDGCFLCSRICPVKAIKMIPATKSRMFAGTFRYGKMVYGRLAPGEENSGKLVNVLRNKATEYAKNFGYKTVILDGPPGIGCPVISTITGVDKVVIVTEPTISGLLDMERSYECSSKSSGQIYVIVNKYDLNMEITHVIENWCEEQGVPVVALLPYDEHVVDAMVEGMTLVEYNEESNITKLLRNAYNFIMQN
ncbi:MAG: 4Fe-4S binding protein [Bacteroidales bacterium]|nr:4Fe-4S binding protein [Bacteroidales bacterium]MDD4822741.1 4Fe-4S binding protein [Bacteroidales bacterium]